jgi:indole-3-glycerol phosphate synthase
MNILEKIVADQIQLVAEKKLLMPISKIEGSEYFQRPCYSLKASIGINNYPTIIAEFKRRSPSKPAINIHADIASVPLNYEKAGASAISILTNDKYFGGKDEDIISNRPLLSIPILRKEFIIDEYQLYEAKAMGADLILLIAEVMDANGCLFLAQKAKELGLEVLMELHDESGIKKINQYVDFIGINNRNLKTFETSIAASINLGKKLPEDFIKVSESGLSKEQDVVSLFQEGYQAFLIGESFMKYDSPGEACAVFIQNIQSIINEN